MTLRLGVRRISLAARSLAARSLAFCLTAALCLTVGFGGGSARAQTAGADSSTSSAMSASRLRPSFCRIKSIFKSIGSNKLIKLGFIAV